MEFIDESDPIIGIQSRANIVSYTPDGLRKKDTFWLGRFPSGFTDDPQRLSMSPVDIDPLKNFVTSLRMQWPFFVDYLVSRYGTYYTFPDGKRLVATGRVESPGDLSPLKWQEIMSVDTHVDTNQFPIAIVKEPAKEPFGLLPAEKVNLRYLLWNQGRKDLLDVEFVENGMCYVFSRRRSGGMNGREYDLILHPTEKRKPVENFVPSITSSLISVEFGGKVHNLDLTKEMQRDAEERRRNMRFLLPLNAADDIITFMTIATRDQIADTFHWPIPTYTEFIDRWYTEILFPAERRRNPDGLVRDITESQRETSRDLQKSRGYYDYCCWLRTLGFLEDAIAAQLKPKDKIGTTESEMNTVEDHMAYLRPQVLLWLCGQDERIKELSQDDN